MQRSPRCLRLAVPALLGVVLGWSSAGMARDGSWRRAHDPAGQGPFASCRADEPPDDEQDEDGGGWADFHRAPRPEAAPGPDADLFSQAVALQERGRYVEARRLLWRLLDHHPASPFAPEARDRSEPNAFLGYTRMHEARPSARRIDVALMGDGYLLARQDRFDRDAVGHLKVLLQEPTFEEYEPYFCFWRFNLASAETGVDEVDPPPPDEEREARDRRRPRRPARRFSTALDCKAAGPQGQVMANPRRVWHYLSYLEENDALAVVFAKHGSLGMGGMGIATTGPRGVVVHEVGHAFSGLLDEYANNPGEPFGFVESANTTTNQRSPPWKHFLEAKIPGVGVYEGAATFQRGVWRPVPSSAMNTGGREYCPVCREATVLTIYSYVSPIDEARPSEREVLLAEEGWPSFEVVPMQPRTHDLEVTFHLGPAPEATSAREGDEAAPEDRFGDELLTPEEREMWRRIKARREAEGRSAPLPSLVPVKPGLVRRAAGTGGEPPPDGEVLRTRTRRSPGGARTVAAVLPPSLAPGRYLLTAVVRDGTKPRGARHPWVLLDPRGLLEDRRSWTLIVPEEEGAPRGR